MGIISARYIKAPLNCRNGRPIVFHFKTIAFFSSTVFNLCPQKSDKMPKPVTKILRFIETGSVSGTPDALCFTLTSCREYDQLILLACGVGHAGLFCGYSP